MSIRDCAFDASYVNTDDAHDGNSLITDYNYNAFLQGANRTTPQGANDVIVTNFNWQSSWFGNFYLPTNSTLINAGSVTNSALVGLYHHTLLTAQTKETTSRLDIGCHWIAADGNGNPLDSDGDGLADYLEDSNGNGSYASGDLANWQNADTDGDGVNDGLEVIQGRNPLVAGTVPDSSNLIKLQVFTPLR